MKAIRKEQARNAIFFLQLHTCIYCLYLFFRINFQREVFHGSNSFFIQRKAKLNWFEMEIFLGSLHFLLLDQPDCQLSISLHWAQFGLLVDQSVDLWPQLGELQSSWTSQQAPGRNVGDCCSAPKCPSTSTSMWKGLNWTNLDDKA